MNTLNKIDKADELYVFADYTYDIGTGCEYDCFYCISKLSYESCNTLGYRWSYERLHEEDTSISELADGIVMFPANHDVTEQYIDTYINVLRTMLVNNNQVVIKTKPSYLTIKRICDEFVCYKQQLLFRMTITSLNDDLSAYWEQWAPLPSERVSALKYAFDLGYQTAVSVDPMIDTVESSATLYHSLTPYLTEDIWFGKMDNVHELVSGNNPKIIAAAKEVERNQSDENILWLYQQLNDQPKVRWKKSIREVVRRHIK